MEMTDVPGLVRQSKGIFTNTNDAEYHAYMKRKQALDKKDEEIQSLKNTINILMERLDKLESK